MPFFFSSRFLKHALNVGTDSQKHHKLHADANTDQARVIRLHISPNTRHFLTSLFSLVHASIYLVHTSLSIFFLFLFFLFSQSLKIDLVLTLPDNSSTLDIKRALLRAPLEPPIDHTREPQISDIRLALLENHKLKRVFNDNAPESAYVARSHTLNRPFLNEVFTALVEVRKTH